MHGLKSILLCLSAIIVVGAFAIQFRSLNQIRSELAEVRNELNLADGSARQEQLTDRSATDSFAPAPRDQRLAGLEQAVKELTDATRYLKERGQLPLASNDIEDARARFLDSARSDRDRLRALQMLRRNGAVPDDLVVPALAWLQSATNGATRRALLAQLEGVTNAALKQPLLSMAGQDQDAGVREEAIENIRHFINDPQVEALLWNVAKSDQNRNVREEAADALRAGPFSESRLAALQQRALDSNTSLDERLLALRTLNRADANAEAATAALAELAQTTTNPADKLKLFRAFDRVQDPVVKMPLVYGLQDPNPLVREEAVDALADFKSDPAVEQWLRYVSQNDGDSQVRREALRALENR
jgi:HEAT repeat protein